jgi:hypothetical protein
MRLIMISLTAMIVSTICLSTVFMHALYTPTRLGVGDWTTTVTAANDWAEGNEERLLPAILHDTHGKNRPTNPVR